MVDVMRSNMLLSNSVLHWLQRQSALWPLALGSVLGLGIGAGALWGIGGLIGAAVCLVVLGTACWCAREAEPVLVGVDRASTPQEASSATALEPAPEPEPLGGRIKMLLEAHLEQEQYNPQRFATFDMDDQPELDAGVLEPFPGKRSRGGKRQLLLT